MLFKQKHLEGIKAGTITLAFRNWVKPAVNAGSLVHTAVGQVAITSVETMASQQLSEADARQAGFDDLEALRATLDQYGKGKLYRIGVRYQGEDPRIALREQTGLDTTAYDDIAERLERLDRYSKEGDWTQTVLEVIRDNPRLRAGDLALKTGKTKEWLKLNIRKLKNLGLTISHETGYELSPLGKELLERMGK
ncbi:ASCH domain-containing protein [Taibaiella koreensis]|uniref:ASCH domain-containing protein n=1 Tax=Taibaiella koreensis TaxID=1268548 RepID=UPI000E59E55D|nr:ASCH domain-containing protein [Taibaiella koreensis]